MGHFGVCRLQTFDKFFVDNLQAWIPLFTLQRTRACRATSPDLGRVAILAPQDCQAVIRITLWADGGSVWINTFAINAKNHFSFLS